MQFDPEHFPVKDWKFVPSSTLGMLAREVEQMQYINLMKTLGPTSPVLPVLLRGVVETSSLGNRQQLLQMLDQMNQPNPQEEQIKAQVMQLQMQKAQVDIAKTASEVEMNKAEATKDLAEASIKPEEVRAKILQAISTNLPNEDDKIQAEFDRRAKIAELMLKEADMDQNREIVELQMQKNMKNLTK